MAANQRLGDTYVAAHDLSLAMPHREIQAVYPLRKRTWRRRVDHEMDPPILKASPVICHQGNIPPRVVAVQPREHAQLGQQLETVTDAEHQPTRLHKGHQTIDQAFSIDPGVANSIGTRLGSAKVVPVKKTAWENDDLVATRIHFPVSQKIQVHEIDDVELGQFKSPSRFKLAIDAVAGRNQGLYSGQFPVAPMRNSSVAV